MEALQLVQLILGDPPPPQPGNDARQGLARQRHRLARRAREEQRDRERQHPGRGRLGLERGEEAGADLVVGSRVEGKSVERPATQMWT